MAKEVSKICSVAPFGRKDQTIYDTSIRNTLQLEPSQFSFANPKWETTLQTMLQNVAAELGITTSLSCRLYKLLLYETGSFFKPHRDTEKEDRMFATLVVQVWLSCM